MGGKKSKPVDPTSSSPSVPSGPSQSDYHSLLEKNQQLTSQLQQTLAKFQQDAGNYQLAKYYEEQIKNLTAEINETKRKIQDASPPGVSREEYQRALKDLEATRQQLMKMTSRHAEVKTFHDKEIENLKRRHEERKSSVLLMGPKGAGKSTFLALRGLGAKPSNDTRDGTKEILRYSGEDGITFIDTIGIGFDNRGISKMLAYFMLNEFPSSVICFCGARSQSESEMLTSTYAICNIYLCEINAQRFNSDHQNPRRNKSKLTMREFYAAKFGADDEKDIYPKLGQENHVTHLSPIDPNRDSFQKLQSLLLDGEFPEATLSSEIGFLHLFKFQVFDQMRKLSELKKRGSEAHALQNFFNDKD